MLCAQRADDSTELVRAHKEDHRLHGGLGWLWKHVGLVAFAAVGWRLLRMYLMHLIRAH